MKKLWKSVLIIGLLMIPQTVISVVQLSRYHYNEDTPNNNYCCIEMSMDAEKFFESIGIHTLVANGNRYDYSNLSYVTSRDIRYANVSGLLPKIEKSHVWLILDFDGFYIPFESIALLPFFDPSILLSYEDVAVSEGFYNGDVFIGAEPFEWRPYP